jgi:hypothetical protein
VVGQFALDEFSGGPGSSLEKPRSLRSSRTLIDALSFLEYIVRRFPGRGVWEIANLQRKGF